MKTKTNVVPGWLSPSAVMDTLFDVREPGCEELGYALLRPRAKKKLNSAAALGVQSRYLVDRVDDEPIWL